MNAVVALFVLSVGLLPAVALSEGSIVAVPLAGATTGLICAAAAMGSLATRTPLTPWVTVAAVSANAVAIWALRRSGLLSSWQRSVQEVVSGRVPAASMRQVAALGIVAVVASPVLAATRSAPVAWDPRSIWFFHASWFHAGGARAAAAMGNLAYVFAQPDYPPLAPATNAALWSFYRGEDRAVSLSVNVWLSLSAVALVGVLVSRLVRPRAQLVAAAVGGLLALGLFGASGGTAMDGLVDLLWASWLVAGALSVLVLPTARTNQLVGSTCLAAAALTKGEGVAITFVVLVALALRCRRQLPAVLWTTSALLPSMLWMVLVRDTGAISSGTVNVPGVKGLLARDPAVWGRFGPTLSSVMVQLWPLVLASIPVLGLAAVVLAAHRRRSGAGSGGWLVGLATAAVVVFVGVYVTGAHEVHWWLRTSASRTTTVVRVLLLTELAVAVSLAADLVLCGPWERPRLRQDRGHERLPAPSHRAASTSHTSEGS